LLPFRRLGDRFRQPASRQFCAKRLQPLVMDLDLTLRGARLHRKQLLPDVGAAAQLFQQSQPCFASLLPCPRQELFAACTPDLPAGDTGLRNFVGDIGHRVARRGQVGTKERPAPTQLRELSVVFRGLLARGTRQVIGRCGLDLELREREAAPGLHCPGCRMRRHILRLCRGIVSDSADSEFSETCGGGLALGSQSGCLDSIGCRRLQQVVRITQADQCRIARGRVECRVGADRQTARGHLGFQRVGSSRRIGCHDLRRGRQTHRQQHERQRAMQLRANSVFRGLHRSSPSQPQPKAGRTTVGHIRPVASDTCPFSDGRPG
jgi:hypothetical protein